MAARTFLLVDLLTFVRRRSADHRTQQRVVEDLLFGEGAGASLSGKHAGAHIAASPAETTRIQVLDRREIRDRLIRHLLLLFIEERKRRVEQPIDEAREARPASPLPRFAKPGKQRAFLIGRPALIDLA